MMLNRIKKSFLILADEFLVSYLNTGHNNGTMVFSRLFLMGKCLDLYAKGLLLKAEQSIDFNDREDLSDILISIDPSLRINPVNKDLAENMFTKKIVDFDPGLYALHKSEFEFFLASKLLLHLNEEFTQDLTDIFPGKISTLIVNNFFTDTVIKLRNKYPSDILNLQNQVLKRSFNAIEFSFRSYGFNL
jgi:hypothetical protein